MSRPVVFKCPQTGMNVQHSPTATDDDEPKGTHKSIVCPACSKLHFLNRLTGKLLGQE